MTGRPVVTMTHRLTCLLLLAGLGALAPAAAAPPAKPQPRAVPAHPNRPANTRPAVKTTPRPAPRPATAAEAWAHALAGRDEKAEEAFAARLGQDPADLSAAIGLAALLDARGDAGGAQDVLARALGKGAKGPLVPGAVAGLAAMTGRSPDGGAAALPALTAVLRGPGRVAELHGIAAQAAADTLSRTGRADEASALLRGQGGYVGTWTLVGPYGRFDRLDLLRPFPPERGDLAPPASAADGLPPLRIATTFHDGRGIVPLAFRHFGLVYAVTDLVVKQPVEVRLAAASPGSFRLFVDGRLAATADRVREHPPIEVAVRAKLSPGRHRVLLKLANADRFLPFTLAVEPLGGAPVLGESVVEAPVEGTPDGAATVTAWPALLDAAPAVGPATDPAAVVAATWWLGLRNLDERTGPLLRAARAQWPKAPLFTALLGEWALGARTGKSADEDLAQARTLLGEAAGADARFHRARLLVARMDESAGQLTEAWQGAEAVLAAAAEDTDALALQYRVAMRRGWGTEAERRIDRARAAAPGRVDVLESAIEAYRKNGSTRKLGEALAERARRDPLYEAWADHLATAGRTAEARAAWERMIAARPSYLYPYFGLARLLSDTGEYDAALALLERAAALYPTEAMIPFRRAGVLALAGRDKDAAAELQRALEIDPSRVELWESLLRRGEKDPLAPWLGNAREILAAAREPAAGTDSALLADIASVLVDPQGGQTELYQGVHAVYTRAGVEREGELDVLPGSRLQGLRIHKAGGGYADVQAGDKRPVSLPGLEPGDAVEYVWRRYIPPFQAIPGGLDNRTLFLFQGEDREYVLSRYVISHDRRLPVEVCGNTRGLAATDETQGNLRIRSWTARQMPRLSGEPHLADPLEITPNVRLGMGTTWADIGELVKANLAGMLQPDEPLPALADESRRRAGSKDPLALARAMHGVILEKIRAGGAPLMMGTPASVAASAGEGNRAAVALALARMLGLDARLLLTRPVEQKGRQLDCPSPGAFPYVVVVLQLGDRRVFLDYTDADHPFDALPPRLAGSDALEVPLALDAPAALVELPRRDPGVLQETVAELQMDRDGRVSGTLTITARGSFGAVLRRLLGEVPPDQKPNVYRQIAGESFPGATVTQTTIDGMDKPEEPLVLRLAIEGGSWGRRTPNGLALPVVAHRLGLLGEYGSLPGRQYAMLLDAQEYRSDTVTVRMPGGLAPREMPSAVTLGGRFGAYAMLAKNPAPGLLSVQRSAVVPPTRVEPGEYAEFREFARGIDAAESREILLGNGGA